MTRNTNYINICVFYCDGTHIVHNNFKLIDINSFSHQTNSRAKCKNANSDAIFSVGGFQTTLIGFVIVKIN